MVANLTQHSHIENASNYAGVEMPLGICLSCFSGQQRHFYPYWIYCRHSEVLAVINSEREWDTFDCAADEVGRLVQKELGMAA